MSKRTPKTEIKLTAGYHPFVGKGTQAEALAAKNAAMPVEDDDEEKSCMPDVAALQSDHSVAAILPTAETKPLNKEYPVTLTLSKLSKNGKNAIYTGAAIAVTIGVSAFVGKTAPQHIQVADGAFAGPKAARTPREQMTPAEKEAAKLARKNAPKPTLAEKVAKAEARAAALKAKLAGAQPSL